MPINSTGALTKRAEIVMVFVANDLGLGGLATRLCHLTSFSSVFRLYVYIYTQICIPIIMFGQLEPCVTSSAYTYRYFVIKRVVTCGMPLSS